MKCPEHHVDYKVVKTTCEQHGVILKDVKALRCPVDGEELFTVEQAEAIRQRIAFISPLPATFFSSSCRLATRSSVFCARSLYLFSALS